MNYIPRSKRWRSTTTSTRTTTTAMSTTTTCLSCLLPLAPAWDVGRGTILYNYFWKYLFSNSDGREMLLAWTASSYRRQGSKWMDRCGIIMYLLLCNVLDCYIKPEKDLPMHVVRQMHRYMAVPRTPVQTDRLDTTEASAVYRATRDNNNECDRQVKSKQQKHPMW